MPKPVRHVAAEVIVRFFDGDAEKEKLVRDRLRFAELVRRDGDEEIVRNVVDRDKRRDTP